MRFFTLSLFLTGTGCYAQQQVPMPGFATDNIYNEYRTMSLDELRSMPVRNKKIIGTWEATEIYFIGDNGEEWLLDSMNTWIMSVSADHLYELDALNPTGEFYWTMSAQGDTLNLHPMRDDSTFYAKPYVYSPIVKCNSRKLIIYRQDSSGSSRMGYKLIFRRPR